MKRCNNCSHCVKVNKNRLYAVCDETGRTFMMWHGEDDTRENSCDKWEYYLDAKRLEEYLVEQERQDISYLNPHLKNKI